MSTILKALRRLEHERIMPSGDRPLREEITGGAVSALEGPGPRRSSWPVPTAAAVFGLGIGLSLWWISPKGEEQLLEPTRTAASQPTRGELASPPPPVRIVTAPEEPSVAAPRDPQVAVVPRPKRGSLIAAEQASPTTPIEEARAPEPVPASPSASAALPNASPPRTVVAARRAAQAAAEPVSKPQPTPVQVASAEAPRASAPPVREVKTPSPKVAKPAAEATAPKPAAKPKPAAVASKPPSSLGALRVERTLWHPRAERRVAVLRPEKDEEVRRYREGDWIGAVQIKQIEPSGVVFVERGVETRRRVGEGG